MLLHFLCRRSVGNSGSLRRLALLVHLSKTCRALIQCTASRRSCTYRSCRLAGFSWNCVAAALVRRLDHGLITGVDSLMLQFLRSYGSEGIGYRAPCRAKPGSEFTSASRIQMFFSRLNFDIRPVGLWIIPEMSLPVTAS